MSMYDTIEALDEVEQTLVQEARSAQEIDWAALWDELSE